jgi:putative sterol carrier protein
MKFLSDEWIELAKQITKEKLHPEKDLKNATTSLLNIIENIPPDGRRVYFYISVKNGNIKDMLIDKTGSILEKDAEFVVTGNYDTFVQIVKGEMTTLIALIKNRVKIKGDKLKALQFSKSIDKLNDCLREINTQYY